LRGLISKYALISLLSLYFMYIMSSNEIWANLSPSFSNQQINDGLNDWVPTTSRYGTSPPTSSYDTTKNISECKTNDNDFPFPDIRGVDYVSDGKTLNATIWLSKEISRHRYDDEITVGIDSFRNTNLGSYLNYTIDYYNASSDDFTVIESNTKSLLSGRPAYSLLWNGSSQEDNTRIKTLEIGTVVGDRQYYMVLHTKHDNFSNLLPTFYRVKDSFEIEPKNESLSSKGMGFSGYSRYYNATLGIDIQYPSNWEKVEEGSEINFYAPYEDKTVQYREYALALDSISIYDLDADYYVWYSWDPISQTWTRIIENQRSEYGTARTISKQNNYTGFYEEGGTSVLLSLDLSLVNYPNKYVVLTEIYDEYANNGHNCSLNDFTGWTSFPPPQFNITVPSIASMRAGEEKTLPLLIKSDSQVDSEITFSTNKTGDMELSVKPNHIQLPSSGSTAASMKVRVPPNQSAGTYMSDIHGEIYLSSPVDSNFESYGKASSANVSIDKPMQIEILEPLSIDENLKQFTNRWITPVTGIWSFLVGVAVVLGPLMARWYDKRRKRNIDI
jgi:hypothetical protein